MRGFACRLNAAVLLATSSGCTGGADAINQFVVVGPTVEKAAGAVPAGLTPGQVIAAGLDTSGVR